MVVLIFGQMKNGQFKNLILPLPFVFLSGETLTSSDVVFLGLTTEDVNPIPYLELTKYVSHFHLIKFSIVTPS